MLLVRSLLIFTLAGVVGSMLGELLVFQEFDRIGMISFPLTLPGACLVGCAYGTLVQAGRSRALAYVAAIGFGALAGGLMLLVISLQPKIGLVGAAFGAVTSVIWAILDIAITSVWRIAPPPAGVRLKTGRRAPSSGTG